MEKGPTDSELEVLQIIWKQGASTVRQVNDVLNTQRDVGYTTTLKIMQIMYEKGLVSREEQSRSHIYTSNVSEKETKKGLVQKFVDATFSGSAMQLVMQALGNHEATPEELDGIKALIEKIEKNQDL